MNNSKPIAWGAAGEKLRDRIGRVVGTDVVVEVRFNRANGYEITFAGERKTPEKKINHLIAAIQFVEKNLDAWRKEKGL